MARVAMTISALPLLVLASCGEGQQSRAAVPDRQLDVPRIEVVAPRLRRPLLSDDGTLLSPEDVVASDDALLILDGPSDEVWRMSLMSPFKLTRISRPRQFGQSDVFAMASHRAGLSVLGVDGLLRIMQREDPDKLAHSVRAFAPMQRPLALGEWTAGGWVAVHSILRLQGTPTDSIIVSAVSSDGRVSRVYGYERLGRQTGKRFLTDPMKARVLDNRVVMVGSDPARIVVVTDAAIIIDTLLDAPQRPVGEREAEGIHRMLADTRTPQAIRDADPPWHRPAVTNALPFDGGYLVVAQGGETAKFVDLYCGRTFRRTVLARAGLNKIYVVSNGVVAIDEPPDGEAERPERLSFYRSQDFIPECAR